jgi:short-subunit dehydrogenase
LSESLRWALAPHGIGVSVLCPGLVKSQIYESEQIRPAHLATDIGPVDAEFIACLPQIHELGMTPDEVGEKVLAGVCANALYIFPHPEFKDELREIFTDVLDAFPDEQPEPKRLEFEEHRRRMKAEAPR